MSLTEYEKTLLTDAFKDTLYLLLVTGILVFLIGSIIGLTLFLTELNGSKKYRLFHKIFGSIMDIFRSVPFIILMIITIPVTVWLVGTMLGPNAAIPSLVVSAAPFYGRVFYNALRDIPKGQIEAIHALGANKRTLIKLLFKEAMPSIISGFTVTLVSLVGFIAAAGAVGAGGLGDLARRRALTMDYEMMYAAVILLLVIVLVIQIIGDYLAKRIDKR